MRLCHLAVPALVILAVLAGCGSSSSSGGDGPKVVATTTEVADLARNVAGRDADVTGILRPNSDPHEYEPRPSDIRATAGAAVVLESGQGIDDWMDEVVDESGSDAAVVDLGARVPQRVAGEGEARYDPHWWHDPRNVEAAAGEIAAALAKADPDRAATYERNAEAYARKVRTLDRAIERCMDAVPKADRKLVTDHDAFGYFARRYGITVVGAVIPSQTTQAQPSARDLARLSDTIRREGVKAIFPESSVGSRVAKAVARQTGASADRELYGDTLGPPGSSGDTYLKMEAHNADQMVRGFTGGARGCS